MGEPRYQAGPSEQPNGTSFGQVEHDRLARRTVAQVGHETVGTMVGGLVLAGVAADDERSHDDTIT